MTVTQKIRMVRFTPVQRVFHALLMVSFLIMGATGLARMYMETAWGRSLGALFGGYDAARTVHIYVGVFMLIGFTVHLLYLLARIDWRRFPISLWGPDSLLPGPGDVKQFFQHIVWFLGLRRPPDFDRWGYWENLTTGPFSGGWLLSASRVLSWPSRSVPRKSYRAGGLTWPSGCIG